MTTTLDVLLLEASPGDGATDADLLEGAGHRVLRCYDPDAPRLTAHPSGLIPCVALTDGSCPLDGHVDVALLARRGVIPRPGPGETGVRCAIRAGVPVVEDGGDLLDPFAPWIDRRTTSGQVVSACEAAAVDSFDPVVRSLREMCTPILERSGIDPDQLVARFERADDDLLVRLSCPPLDAHLSRAIAARVLDALRAFPRRFATVEVSWSPL